MMKIAILQSNYIPWKGYFDIINMADTFVIYDEMQFTKRDWRNRNIIKTPTGLKWLSIPVVVKGKFNQRIDETVTNDRNWNISHWKTLISYYSKAPFFKYYNEMFEDLYIKTPIENLSEINLFFIKAINNILAINTPLIYSKYLNVSGERSERLVRICKALNANYYISGPAAKNYLEESLFSKEGITIEWMDYSGYKEYPQLYPPFEHGVSILDLIFNVGTEASKYLKSIKSE